MLIFMIIEYIMHALQQFLYACFYEKKKNKIQMQNN